MLSWGGFQNLFKTIFQAHQAVSWYLLVLRLQVQKAQAQALTLLWRDLNNKMSYICKTLLCQGSQGAKGRGFQHQEPTKTL